MKSIRAGAFSVASLLAIAWVGISLAAEKAKKPPLVVAGAGPGGAAKLSLAAGLSFTSDSSSAFPIRGENLGEGRIASDRPTAIFFGTSHCWNTNREAERFVALYRKHKDEARFLVVDLEHPSPDQRRLIERFYGGAIPTLAFLDRKGNAVYNRAGETARERSDISGLERIFREASAH
jgi:hypothetical protein